jgi:hypothetical protein
LTVLSRLDTELWPRFRERFRHVSLGRPSLPSVLLQQGLRRSTDILADPATQDLLFPASTYVQRKGVPAVNRLRTNPPTQVARAVADSGLPRYVLAAQIRMGPADFGRVFRGMQIPTLSQAQRIAEQLGQTPEELFDTVA